MWAEIICDRNPWPLPLCGVLFQVLTQPFWLCLLTSAIKEKRSLSTHQVALGMKGWVTWAGEPYRWFDCLHNGKLTGPLCKKHANAAAGSLRFLRVCQPEVIVKNSFLLQSAVSAKRFIVAAVWFCSPSLFAWGQAAASVNRFSHNRWASRYILQYWKKKIHAAVWW